MLAVEVLVEDADAARRAMATHIASTERAIEVLLRGLTRRRPPRRRVPTEAVTG